MKSKKLGVLILVVTLLVNLVAGLYLIMEDPGSPLGASSDVASLVGALVASIVVSLVFPALFWVLIASAFRFFGKRFSFTSTVVLIALTSFAGLWLAHVGQQLESAETVPQLRPAQRSVPSSRSKVEEQVPKKPVPKKANRGMAVDAFVSRHGFPQGRMSVGDKETLTYPYMLVTAQSGIVQSVDITILDEASLTWNSSLREQAFQRMILLEEHLKQFNLTSEQKRASRATLRNHLVNQGLPETLVDAWIHNGYVGLEHYLTRAH